MQKFMLSTECSKNADVEMRISSDFLQRLSTQPAIYQAYITVVSFF